MLARIGWYLLFLLAAGLYLALAKAGQTKQEGILSSQRGSVFISNQLAILTGLFPIIVIPWILTGFFSRNFLFLILVAFEASAVLTFISFYVFQLTPANVGKRFALWGGEFGMKHPFWSLFVMLLALLGLGAYFIFATYFYFAYPLRSLDAVRRILLLNFALYGLGTLIAVATYGGQLASAHVKDRTRRGLFFAQATIALQTGLMLTLYLGLIGVGAERFLPASLNLSPAYFKYVPMGILTALYLLILVIPYFAGLENRRRAEISLYNLHLDLVNKIIDAVGIPDIHDSEQLKALRDNFTRQSDEWIQSELIIRELANKVEHPDAGPPAESLQSLVGSYHAFKDEDLRFVRLTWIDEMKAKMAEIIAQYEQYAGEPDRVSKYVMLAEPLGEHFRDQRERLEKKLNEAEERKIVAPVIARLIPTLGAVPVVWQYGHKIIQMLPLKR